ncbi:YhfC family intramembrane metalloprotease [Anoxybacillus sp. LAT_35]|uniref:YhfC family intramembrane metalloprotease n=1 Tax=unclassified Anoxybacillus TaxID=2639704 RepID=UPI001EDAFB75|nr:MULTISPECIES: YhfC family intramembrane metalloprotease [unclassified Anoxybacillus]MCG5026066.1 YhfC family intramembrane metalloprotease [Anoxybacillus flavithermus]MCG6195998.1 YhfC family intramembrane metalloprotease [Anoxybacillus sp. LAT_38]MCG3084213.1 YhfC family intramembrane metalloprotease [Anoxybacillus sp. LAT27]MCG6170558.1 YhfC family intramembrane metalloprotease [Anoxybacillus sp. LAT_11]MCG6174699.1 YhfC family intramembrane metalloprotease [Anoxybacillus sp. LAT_31]
MKGEISLVGASVQLFLSLIVPLALVIYGRKKRWLSWKAFGVGLLIFVLFSQVLEKVVHMLVVDPSGTSLKGINNVWAFVAYGALAAGVFEEMGRYVGFRFMLKNNRTYGDGLSFGLGHGGIEAVLIGGVSAINMMILSHLVQTGQFEQIASSLPATQVEMLKTMLNQPDWMYVLGGIERTFAIAIHIALSLLVLYGVRKGQFRYVVYAILIHTLIDVVPALYQVKIISNVWVIETIFAFFAIASLVFIRRIAEKF